MYMYMYIYMYMYVYIYICISHYCSCHSHTISHSMTSCAISHDVVMSARRWTFESFAPQVCCQSCVLMWCRCMSVLLPVLLSVPYTILRLMFRGLAHCPCGNKEEHRRDFFVQRWNYADTLRYDASSTRSTYVVARSIWLHIFRDTVWHYLTMTSHCMPLDRVTHIT